MKPGGDNLGGDVVARAFALLAGHDLSPEAAAAKAALLGSKQELLAFLLVRENVWAHEDGLRALLQPGGQRP